MSTTASDIYYIYIYSILQYIYIHTIHTTITAQERGGATLQLLHLSLLYHCNNNQYTIVNSLTFVSLMSLSPSCSRGAPGAVALHSLTRAAALRARCPLYTRCSSVAAAE
jgi:hypothetical protein